MSDRPATFWRFLFSTHYGPPPILSVLSIVLCLTALALTFR